MSILQQPICGACSMWLALPALRNPPSQILLVLPVCFKHDGAVLDVRVVEVIK